MAKKELQVFDRYHYGRRGVLVPGDRFRVGGGPVYITDAGNRIGMHERGVFTFLRYCIRGSSRWLEARRERDGSTVVLWVGASRRSLSIPNLLRRPYRVRKLRSASRQPKTKPQGIR